MGSREPMDTTMRKTADDVVQGKKVSKLIDKDAYAPDMKRQRDIRSHSDFNFGMKPNKEKD